MMIAGFQETVQFKFQYNVRPYFTIKLTRNGKKITPYGFKC